MKEDLPELFRCMLCQAYFSIDQLKEVKVKDLLLPKNICMTCYRNLLTKTGGISNAINLPEEDTKT